MADIGKNSGATNGSDRLVGTNGADRMDGMYGNDTMYGRDGADKMHGGFNKDTMFGGAGDDVMSGGADGDYLYGEAGNDLLWGATDVDYLSGGKGADKFYFRSSDFKGTQLQDGSWYDPYAGPDQIVDLGSADTIVLSEDFADHYHVTGNSVIYENNEGGPLDAELARLGITGDDVPIVTANTAISQNQVTLDDGNTYYTLYSTFLASGWFTDVYA